MTQEQVNIANATKAFMEKWGLKNMYVAKVGGISDQTLSRFVNHRIALSSERLGILAKYMEDYERRNS